MKVMQYITDAVGELRPYELKPAGSDCGNALVLQVSEAANPDPIMGIGVAITGSSCYELNTMDEAKRTAFLQKIYGKDGLNLSMARLSIGASDYSPEIYSYDDVPGDEALAHFSVERDEAYVIPMIKEALKVRPDLYLFASPWTPPGWMKTGGSLCGGFMREAYIDIYADYFVKFLKAYQAHGIDVKAVTAQNETETHQNGHMTACMWHPDIEAKFVLSLKRKLHENGMDDIAVWMLDHNFSAWRRVLWQMQEYPELLEKCDAIAFHYYDGGVEMLDNLRAIYPDMKFHFTEGGPRLYDHYDNDWCKWTSMMSKAFNHGCRSFTGWNLMLDETGGPNIGPFFCGGLATLNSQTGEITYSGQYKALGHFTRFIQPGAVVHQSKILDDLFNMSGYGGPVPLPVTSCALRNPDGKQMVVLSNGNKTKRQVQYFYGGQWWYIELLPESASTIVFA